jgi:hypothetical protein
MKQSNSPSEQEIETIGKNWDLFKKLSTKITDNKNVSSLVELLEQERTFLITPYSTRTEYTGCYHGGLLEFSLRLTEKLITLKKQVFDKYPEITNNSLLLIGLFGSIGKTGLTEDKPYYIPQTNDWHLKQGNKFIINPELSHFPVSQLTLFKLTEHGISLTPEEWYVINAVHSSKDDQVITHIKDHQPELLLIVKQGMELASLQLKNKIVTGSL